MPITLGEGQEFSQDLVPDGTGTVTVTGEGSTLYGTGLQELYVGYSGDGTLNIGAGGYIESGMAGVGVLPGSTGAVAVDGASAGEGGTPSIWENIGSMFVGGYGEGTLTISAGGEVYAEDLNIGGFDPGSFLVDVAEIGYDPDGTGTVTVMDDGSLLETYAVIVGVTGSGVMNVLDTQRFERGGGGLVHPRRRHLWRRLSDHLRRGPVDGRGRRAGRF